MVPNAVEIVPDTENPEVEVEVDPRGRAYRAGRGYAATEGQPRRCRAETQKAAGMAVIFLAAVIPVAYYSRRDTGGHNRACGGCRLL